MQTTTFYSFKGGVGRTLALANIAAQFADNGKKVLVVDFDLEAPSLSTLFPSPLSTPGVLEYVNEFKEHQASPDVLDYVYEADCQHADGKLWVMPASHTTREYAETLSRIHWRDLYAHHNGFLMIEDLKKQWEARLGADYVFIDSRTGHTDVEGICTRQLPDTLVLMFQPDESNLVGLSEVWRRVQEHSERILPLFVASRVSDEDDEHDLLSTMLTRFSDALGYDECDATIHQYRSLRLLSDPLFTRSRKTTRLAREYAGLAQKIREMDPADEEGVSAHLDYVLQHGLGPDGARRHAILQTVNQNHRDNPAILFKYAVWQDRLGRAQGSLPILNRVLELQPLHLDARIRRARLSAQHDEAALRTTEEDVATILRSPNANASQLSQAIGLRHVCASNVLTLLPQSPALGALEDYEIIELVDELGASRDLMEIAAAIIQALPDERMTDAVISHLVVLLIGLGRFHDAMAVSDEGRRPGEGADDQLLFNYAIAEWGASGSVPRDLFLRLVKQAQDPGELDSINYDQCLALACWAIDETELGRRYIGSALSMIDHRFWPQLSCWSYQIKSGDALREELEAVRALLDGESRTPMFMLGIDHDATTGELFQ
ncbi:MAG: AAA family ATPase [Parvibaculaceae bacterium]